MTAAPHSTATTAPTRTLRRGLLILELLATRSGEHGLGVSEVASAVDLDKATTARLLQTLCALGYAHQDPHTRVFRLTGRLLGLAEAYRSGLEIPARIRPLLSTLRDETGQTVHFGVRDGMRVTYILKLESTASVVAASAVGQSMPVNTTSLGKAMVAALDDPDRERAIEVILLERRTERSITDRDRFRAEIESIRSRGFAVDAGENEEGITCVGSAVLDVTGAVVGAISVAGPSYVVDARIADFGRLCRDTAIAAHELL